MMKAMEGKSEGEGKRWRARQKWEEQREGEGEGGWMCKARRGLITSWGVASCGAGGKQEKETLKTRQDGEKGKRGDGKKGRGRGRGKCYAHYRKVVKQVW